MRPFFFFGLVFFVLLGVNASAHAEEYSFSVPSAPSYYHKVYPSYTTGVIPVHAGTYPPIVANVYIAPISAPAYLVPSLPCGQPCFSNPTVATGITIKKEKSPVNKSNYLNRHGTVKTNGIISYKGVGNPKSAQKTIKKGEWDKFEDSWDDFWDDVGDCPCFD
ncbi:MAG: hypothetical protein V1776_05080 [Candidatus Diapherotrites archaeon]